MARRIIAFLLALLVAGSARADVVVRPIEYKHGDAALEGLLAYDSATSGRRGGVLIAMDAAGNGTLARQRAMQFARLGYAAFAADLFGKGVTPKDSADATRRLRLGESDRTLVRGRAEAALGVLTRQPQADTKRIAAVGYGAGGTAWLELARTGADLEGVAVVHGDLSASNPAEAKKVSAAIFAIVGGDDPRIPAAQIAAFEDEMRGGGVDWQVLRLGGVGHDFTNPQAGRDLKTGAAYDADADRRATAAIKAFLSEALAAPTPPAAARPVAKPAVPAGVPERVLKMLEYVDKHGDAPDSYEGGRTFGNFERRLPLNDAHGRRIKYREWDVNPLRSGVNRGPERLVTGSDGSAHFTDDHYRTFQRIR
jgi:dienelactone hydrolase